MNIQQIQKKHGTLFIVETEFDDNYTGGISKWLLQNNIQHIFNYPHQGEYHYFIIDPASIMAFKLRWI